MNQIDISQIKLSQLRALVTVAECGSFSEAALKLEISQSAVSHAIASLEAELGVVLLSRGRHGAYPTPVGEQIIGYGRQMLQLLQEMLKTANLEKGLNGGIVRVACFRSVATHVLPSAIARFHSRFPEITVSIDEHSGALTVEKALREGHADIGFTNLPASDEFETWEIIRDEYVVLLPPTAKLQTAQLTWEQLATYPLIFPSSACHHLIRKHLQLHKFPPNIAYKVQESSTIVSMVAQGLGVAILAQLSAAPLPPEVQVCSLPVPLERVIGVAVLSNALLTPASFAFLDTVKGVDRFPDRTTA